MATTQLTIRLKTDINYLASPFWILANEFAPFKRQVRLLKEVFE